MRDEPKAYIGGGEFSGVTEAHIARWSARTVTGRESYTHVALVPLVLAANEPGKEILYPVATVILGGLVSCTLLDFLVHPALFWCFGKGAEAAHADDELPATPSPEAPLAS